MPNETDRENPSGGPQYEQGETTKKRPNPFGEQESQGNSRHVAPRAAGRNIRETNRSRSGHRELKRMAIRTAREVASLPSCRIQSRLIG